jgi:ABC-type transport system involved in cytochrome bd biosynthesis fused ATPase/permease subunit
MTDRAQRYLEFYKKQRLEDQWTFYEDRRKEFEAARDEVVNLTVLFMVLTAVAAALAAANIGGFHALWSILAVVFPALSTGLSAYNGLYAFERQAKLYGDAANALFRATADSPDLKPAMEATAFAAAVSAHVQQVEQILSGEQAQWGQLIGEIKPVEPPPAKSNQGKPLPE